MVLPKIRLKPKMASGQYEEPPESNIPAAVNPDGANKPIPTMNFRIEFKQVGGETLDVLLTIYLDNRKLQTVPFLMTDLTAEVITSLIQTCTERVRWFPRKDENFDSMESSSIDDAPSPDANPGPSGNVELESFGLKRALLPFHCISKKACLRSSVSSYSMAGAGMYTRDLEPVYLPTGDDIPFTISPPRDTVITRHTPIDRTQTVSETEPAVAEYASGNTKEIDRMARFYLSIRASPFPRHSQGRNSLAALPPCSDTNDLRYRLKKERFLEEPLPWLHKQGLLLLKSPSLCQNCGYLQVLRYSPDFIDGCGWTCSRIECSAKQPYERGKFFASFPDMSLTMIASMIYHWAYQSCYDDLKGDLPDIKFGQVLRVWKSILNICRKEVLMFRLGGTSINNAVELSYLKFGKFLILGAMERSTRFTRLTALYPSIEVDNNKVTDELMKFVVPGSTVFTNFPQFQELRRRNLLVMEQDPALNPRDTKFPDSTVRGILSYLHDKIQLMFGACSTEDLEIEELCMFLDELQWRERYGHTNEKSFWNILYQICGQRYQYPSPMPDLPVSNYSGHDGQINVNSFYRSQTSLNYERAHIQNDGMPAIISPDSRYSYALVTMPVLTEASTQAPDISGSFTYVSSMGDGSHNAQSVGDTFFVHQVIDDGITNQRTSVPQHQMHKDLTIVEEDMEVLETDILQENREDAVMLENPDLNLLVSGCVHVLKEVLFQKPKKKQVELLVEDSDTEEYNPDVEMTEAVHESVVMRLADRNNQNVPSAEEIEMAEVMTKFSEKPVQLPTELDMCEPTTLEVDINQPVVLEVSPNRPITLKVISQSSLSETASSDSTANMEMTVTEPGTYEIAATHATTLEVSASQLTTIEFTETQEDVIELSGEQDSNIQFVEVQDENIEVAEDIVLSEAQEEDIVLSEAPEEDIVLSEAPEEDIVLLEAQEEDIVLLEAQENGIVLSEVKEEDIVLSEVQEEVIVLSEAQEEDIVLSEAQEEIIGIAKKGRDGNDFTEKQEKSINAIEFSEVQKMETEIELPKKLNENQKTTAELEPRQPILDAVSCSANLQLHTHLRTSEISTMKLTTFDPKDKTNQSTKDENFVVQPITAQPAASEITEAQRSALKLTTMKLATVDTKVKEHTALQSMAQSPTAIDKIECSSNIVETKEGSTRAEKHLDASNSVKILSVPDAETGLSVSKITKTLPAVSQGTENSLTAKQTGGSFVSTILPECQTVKHYSAEISETQATALAQSNSKSIAATQFDSICTIKTQTSMDVTIAQYNSKEITTKQSNSMEKSIQSISIETMMPPSVSMETKKFTAMETATEPNPMKITTEAILMETTTEYSTMETTTDPSTMETITDPGTMETTTDTSTMETTTNPSPMLAATTGPCSNDISRAKPSPMMTSAPSNTQYRSSEDTINPIIKVTEATELKKNATEITTPQSVSMEPTVHAMTLKEAVSSSSCEIQLDKSLCPAVETKTMENIDFNTQGTQSKIPNKKATTTSGDESIASKTIKPHSTFGVKIHAGLAQSSSTDSKEKESQPVKMEIAETRAEKKSSTQPIVVKKCESQSMELKTMNPVESKSEANEATIIETEHISVSIEFDTIESDFSQSMLLKITETLTSLVEEVSMQANIDKEQVLPEEPILQNALSNDSVPEQILDITSSQPNSMEELEDEDDDHGASQDEYMELDIDEVPIASEESVSKSDSVSIDPTAVGASIKSCPADDTSHKKESPEINKEDHVETQVPVVTTSAVPITQSLPVVNKTSLLRPAPKRLKEIYMQVGTNEFLAIKTWPFSSSMQAVLFETEGIHMNSQLCEELKAQEYFTKPHQWLAHQNFIPSIHHCPDCGSNSFYVQSRPKGLPKYGWVCLSIKNCSIKLYDYPSVLRYLAVPMEEVMVIVYHWAIQSDVEKILSDVNLNKDDIWCIYLKLRELCSGVIWQKSENLGQNKHVVKATLVFLGLYGILIAMDIATGVIRMMCFRRVDCQNRRDLMTHLKNWCVPGAVIKTHFPRMDAFIDAFSMPTNSTDESFTFLAEYASSVFMSLFKNVCDSHMSLRAIQGFLDEILWRHRFGRTPPSAFKNIYSLIVINDSPHRRICDNLQHYLSIPSEFVETTHGDSDNPDSLQNFDNSRVRQIPKVSIEDTDQMKATDERLDLLIKELLKINHTKQRSSKKGPYLPCDISVDEFNVDFCTANSDSQQADQVGLSSDAQNQTDECFLYGAIRLNKSMSVDKELSSYQNHDLPLRLPSGAMSSDEDGEATAIVPLPQYQGRGIDLNIQSSHDSNYFSNLQVYKYHCYICTLHVVGRQAFLDHVLNHAASNKDVLMEHYHSASCPSQFSQCYRSSSCRFFQEIDEAKRKRCSLCNVAFASSEELDQHILRTHGSRLRPYVCKICGGKASQHRLIMAHFQKQHSERPDAICPICLQIFPLSIACGFFMTETFCKHLLMHDNKYLIGSKHDCKFCALRFTTEGAFLFHSNYEHSPSSEFDRGRKRPCPVDAVQAPALPAPPVPSISAPPVSSPSTSPVPLTSAPPVHSTSAPPVHSTSAPPVASTSASSVPSTSAPLVLSTNTSSPKKKRQCTRRQSTKKQLPNQELSARLRNGKVIMQNRGNRTYCCLECGSSFIKNHRMYHLKCDCTFSTYCVNSYWKHRALASNTPIRTGRLPEKIKLPSVAGCKCGFMSDDGMAIAHHAYKCKMPLRLNGGWPKKDNKMVHVVLSKRRPKAAAAESSSSPGTSAAAGSSASLHIPPSNELSNNQASLVITDHGHSEADQ